MYMFVSCLNICIYLHPRSILCFTSLFLFTFLLYLSLIVCLFPLSPLSNFLFLSLFSSSCKHFPSLLSPLSFSLYFSLSSLSLSSHICFSLSLNPWHCLPVKCSVNCDLNVNSYNDTDIKKGVSQKVLWFRSPFFMKTKVQRILHFPGTINFLWHANTRAALLT